MAAMGSSSVPVDFPQDPAPVPLKLVVLADAEQVQHDATESKFSKMVLHISLASTFIIFIRVFITVLLVHTMMAGNSYKESQLFPKTHHGAANGSQLTRLEADPHKETSPDWRSTRPSAWAEVRDR
jgi:hypothetical protein